MGKKEENFSLKEIIEALKADRFFSIIFGIIFFMTIIATGAIIYENIFLENLSGESFKKTVAAGNLYNHLPRRTFSIK